MSVDVLMHRGGIGQGQEEEEEEEEEEEASIFPRNHS
jgi:hypothetical protein